MCPSKNSQMMSHGRCKGPSFLTEEAEAKEGDEAKSPPRAAEGTQASHLGFPPPCVVTCPAATPRHRPPVCCPSFSPPSFPHPSS